VHRYPTACCSARPRLRAYCALVSAANGWARSALSRAQLDAAMGYIRGHREIWESSSPAATRSCSHRGVWSSRRNAGGDRPRQGHPRAQPHARVAPRADGGARAALRAPGKAEPTGASRNHARELTSARAACARWSMPAFHVEPDRALARRQRRAAVLGELDARLGSNAASSLTTSITAISPPAPRSGAPASTRVRP